MGSALAGFGVGLLQGIEGGMRRNKEQEERDEDRKMRRETHDLQKQQSEITLKRAKEEEADRNAIRLAAAPVNATVANDVPNDDDGNPMPAAPQHEAGGRRYATAPQAQAAAAQANQPAARAERISLAMMERGKPTEAMKFAEEAQGYADKKWNRDVLSAADGGHDGLAKFMTTAQSGALKGKNVQVVPSQDGKSVTYAILGEDGKVTPTQFTFPNSQEGVVQAAYQLSKIDAGTRYKNMVEADKQQYARSTKERELDLRERNLTEVQLPLAQARAEAAGANAQASLARAEAANRKGAGGEDGKVSREERLRWTSLHSESGRRLSESNKALGALSKDPAFMVMAKDPKSPQAQQLASLQADVQQYKEDRDMYGSLLAGSQGAAARAEREAGKGGGAAAPAGAAEPKPVAPAGKAGSTAPAKAGASRATPVAVADRAAYAKLQPGTYYKAPNGQVYIKQ